MKEELGLRDYLMILSKRRVSATVIFAIFVLVVTAVTFTMTPVYKATAQVYVESPNMQFNIQQQQMENQTDTASYLQTQMNILKSEAIARKVIAKLHLDTAGVREEKIHLSPGLPGKQGRGGGAHHDGQLHTRIREPPQRRGGKEQQSGQRQL